MEYQLVIRLKLRWQLKDKTHYKWSECKRLINTHTGKEIKKTINGGSVGYWIAGTFTPLSKLRSKLELIPKERLPF